MNGLQRYLALMGMTANSLAPQVVDPSAQIEVQLVAICILIGCPKRVFEGSERGQLASGQDDSAWNDRLAHRQLFYITPKIIVPFVDRCIELGILPEPESYGVKWPDLNTLTKPEQAAVAVQLTEALAKYVGGSVENVLPPIDFFIRILGFAQEEAEVIIEAVMESEEDPLTMPSAEEDAADKEFDHEMQQRALDVKAASQKGPPK